VRISTPRADLASRLERSAVDVDRLGRVRAPRDRRVRSRRVRTPPRVARHRRPTARRPRTPPCRRRQRVEPPALLE
jgi:hypothetical protein